MAHIFREEENVARIDPQTMQLIGKVQSSFGPVVFMRNGVVRSVGIVSNPKTPRQCETRMRLAKASEVWRGLSLQERQKWDEVARQSGRKISGFNAFVGEMVRSRNDDIFKLPCPDVPPIAVQRIREKFLRQGHKPCW